MVSILHRTSELENRSKLHWLLGLAVEMLDIESTPKDQRFQLHHKKNTIVRFCSPKNPGVAVN